jgi:Peptidase A4 family
MKVTRATIAVTVTVTAAVSLGLIGLTGSVNAAAGPVTKGTLRPAIHLSHRAAMSPQGIPIDYSGNWSGYIALPKTGKATAFKYVAGSYEVPSVNCSVTNYAFSYHWVGLDGWTDGTVEQDGIGAFCVNGTPDYFAWYEMYPAGVTDEFSVDPGDAITSSVTYNGSGKYQMNLTDQTTGQNFSVGTSCASTCANSSAEVITEGYTSAPYNGTADFGEQHYDTATVTGSKGAVGGLTSPNWNTVESIALGASSDDPDTEPGPLYTTTNLSAFPLTWLAQN